MLMDIIKAYATHNLCYAAAQPLTVKGIVVHSTGCNNPNLKRYVNCPDECGVNPNKNYWDNPTPDGQKKCVHGFIGYDKNKKVRYAQILPYTMACWGCGRGSKGSFNYNPNGHIQFELQEDSMTNATYFKQVWDCAVELCADLCKQYKLDPLGENVIVSHCEAGQKGYASEHGDPDHWFKRHGKTMDDFRAAVKAKMGGTSATNSTKEIWVVQVGAFSTKTAAESYAKEIKKLKLNGKNLDAIVKKK